MTPIPYAAYYPGRRLLRVDGEASVRGAVVGWSAVVKVLEPPETPGTIWDREVRAYQSRLLRELPGGLASPRLLHLDRTPSGAVWLWLERVEDAYAGRWPLEQYGVAAYHLGQLNGAFATRPVPAYDWLDRRWAQLHSTTWGSDEQREREMLLEHPAVRAVFSTRDAGRMRRLVDDQPVFIEALGRLPDTLNHHDASSANLFARRRSGSTEGVGADEWETVAIDWEEIGPGPVGVEVATLVFGSMRRGAFPAERADELERTVLDGYECGLRTGGWSGEMAEVRWAYCAAVALRSFQVLGTLRTVADEAGRERAAPAMGMTAVELVRHRIALLRFLLDRADEASRPMVRGVVGS